MLKCYIKNIPTGTECEHNVPVGIFFYNLFNLKLFSIVGR